MLELPSFTRFANGLRHQTSLLRIGGIEAQLRCHKRLAESRGCVWSDIRCYSDLRVPRPAHAAIRPSCRLSKERGCTQWHQDRAAQYGPHKRFYAQVPDHRAQFGEMTEEEYAKSRARFKKLSAKDVHKIFGPGVDTVKGNNLLNTVQKQRVTGTLDVDIAGPGINKATIAKSLAWLRQNYPIDEDQAIMARLVREEGVIRDWSPQADVDPDEPWGKGNFDRIREKNIAKRKAQEEAEAAAKEKREAEEAKSGTLARTNSKSFREVAVPRKTSPWVEKYRQAAMLSKDDVPKPSYFKITVPTTAFVAVTLALCVALATEYEPPNREARLFPNIPPAAATVGALMALNVAAYACWKIPKLWRFMNVHMLLIAYTPAPTALLGNVFSHQTLYHLAANTVGLWFIGTALHDEIGRGKFLAIYLGCGIFASWASLMRFVIIRNFTFTSLGASGALCGIAGAYCTLFPANRISIAFLPDEWQKIFCLRADFIFWFVFAVEAFNIARGSYRVDHVSHLGGLVSGLVAAEGLKRQARAKRRRRFIEGNAGGPSTSLG